MPVLVIAAGATLLTGSLSAGLRKLVHYKKGLLDEKRVGSHPKKQQCLTVTASVPEVIGPPTSSFDAIARRDPLGDATGVEFDLWVETDLDIAWCVEPPGQDCLAPGDDKRAWAAACRTSQLRRRWADFERLPNASNVRPRPTEGGHAAKDQCFRMLGLPEDAGLADLSKAFRRRALQLHPDKDSAGAEEFAVLTAAVQAAEQELTAEAVCREHATRG